MSDILHFAETRLQEAALLVMASVYALRLAWFLRFKAGRDRFPRTGTPDTDPRRGATWSLFIVAMPWAMESSRRRPWFWVQFAVFHLGVVANISLSFLIPYAPRLLSGGQGLAAAIRVACAAACAVGLLRLWRRIRVPVMRAISTPDDYFSVSLLTVWFAMGALAASNDASRGEGILLAYFLLTAFFLLYVPFSKISHYLYYPFNRWYLGRTMGHRGVFPLPRAPGRGGRP